MHETGALGLANPVSAKLQWPGEPPAAAETAAQTCHVGSRARSSEAEPPPGAHTAAAASTGGLAVPVGVPALPIPARSAPPHVPRAQNRSGPSLGTAPAPLRGSQPPPPSPVLLMRDTAKPRLAARVTPPPPPARSLLRRPPRPGPHSIADSVGVLSPAVDSLAVGSRTRQRT